MSEAKLNLIVLYTNERDQLRNDLTAFGLMFEEHQHGNGPIHDACESHGFCLEIYPSSEANPPTHTRLGLNVPDISKAMEASRSISAETKIEPKSSPWGIRAVVQLRTGLKIELVQLK